MTGLLAGRVAVITGAASGIGLATARLFDKEGARVAGVDLGETPLSNVLSVTGDVSDPASVEEGASRVLDAWGRIDVLVTAAGMSFGKKLGDTSPEEWDRTFAVNVRGTFLWIKAALPSMIASGRGSIVTIASQLALAGGRNSASYIASKGAVLSLTRAVAVDYAANGIRANTLVPGAVETPLLERGLARAGDREVAAAASRARHAMGRFGKPEEVARAALFLASDQSSFTTGAELRVDGGWLAA